MKPFLSLLCACLFLARAHAQTPAGTAPVNAYGGPLYISLSTGMAIPLGDFGPKDAGIEGNSTARLGADQSIQVSYRVWQSISLTVLGGYQTNPYDNAAFNASSQAKEAGVSIQGGTYSAKRLLAGFTTEYSIGRSDRWYFTNRLLLGVQHLQTFARYVYEAGSTPVSEPFSENFHNAFATELGIGAKYRLSKLWFVEGGADFLGATSRLSEASGPLSAGNAVYGGSAFIATINLHLGVGTRI